ncbi:MAG: LysE family transporter [Candidatus Jordarchaeales archaeon]
MYLLLFELFILSFLTGLSGALSPGPLLIVTIDSSLRKGWNGGFLTVLGHLLVEAPLIIALAYGAGSAITNESVKLAVTLIGGCTLLAFGSYTVYSSRHIKLVEVSSTRSPTFMHAERGFSLRPMISGLIATITNPFYWIWWATIGLAMLTYAPLLVMANVNPSIYWASLTIFFNTLSPFLINPHFLLLLSFPPLLSQLMFQLIDFNYLFLGSTLLGWTIIAIGHFSSDIAWYISVSLAIARGRQLINVKLYRIITLLCGLTLILLSLCFLTYPFLHQSSFSAF